MKRAALERQRTIAVWRRHLASHGADAALCACELQPGRFRKGQRVGGCGNARCYLCHSDKLLGLPNRSRQRTKVTFRDWNSFSRKERGGAAQRQIHFVRRLGLICINIELFDLCANLQQKDNDC